MIKKSFRIITLAMALVTCLSASAQEANSLAFRAGTRSPELRNDSITFRFVAPKARKVEVSASWLGYNAARLQMAQGQDGV